MISRTKTSTTTGWSGRNFYCRSINVEKTRFCEACSIDIERKTMKLHACRHCGSRLRTYTELQEHLKTHKNVCVTCYRVFSRPDLLAHKGEIGEYLCEICQRSYSTQTKLARHKRETSCRHSLPPEVKRQKLIPPIEDLEAPPLVDEYGSELQYVIIQHWGSIRTHTGQSSHDTTSD